MTIPGRITMSGFTVQALGLALFWLVKETDNLGSLLALLPLLAVLVGWYLVHLGESHHGNLGICSHFRGILKFAVTTPKPKLVFSAVLLGVGYLVSSYGANVVFWSDPFLGRALHALGLAAPVILIFAIFGNKVNKDGAIAIILGSAVVATLWH